MRARAQRAVSIGDMMRYLRDYNPVSILLQPCLSASSVNVRRGEAGGEAFLVRDDVGEDQWAAIMRILREGLGDMRPITKDSLRVYEKRGSRWVSV